METTTTTQNTQHTHQQHTTHNIKQTQSQKHATTKPIYIYITHIYIIKHEQTTHSIHNTKTHITYKTTHITTSICIY